MVGANELKGPGSVEQNRKAIIAGGKGDEVSTPYLLTMNTWFAQEQDRSMVQRLNMAGSCRHEGRR